MSSAGIALLIVAVLVPLQRTEKDWRSAMDASQALLTQGRYQDALTPLQEALSIAEHSLRDRPELGITLLMLANTHRMNGNYAIGQQYARRAAALLERYAPGSLDHAFTLNELGSNLAHAGKLAEAETVLLKALDMQEKSVGKNGPACATSLANLGFVYVTGAQFEKGIAVLSRAAAIMEMAKQMEDPAYGNVLTSLAVAYRRVGRYGEAEALQRRVLTLVEKLHGPEHPVTATTLDSLSLLYTAMGKLQEADEHSLRALSIYERTLPTGHPDLITALRNRAELLRRLGRVGEAALLEKKAVASTKAH